MDIELDGIIYKEITTPEQFNELFWDTDINYMSENLKVIKMVHQTSFQPMLGVIKPDGTSWYFTLELALDAEKQYGLAS